MDPQNVKREKPALPRKSSHSSAAWADDGPLLWQNLGSSPVTAPAQVVDCLQHPPQYVMVPWPLGSNLNKSNP